MTLLVISPDYASHARPLLTIADAWRAQGERVVVATGPAVAPLVARPGFELVRLELGRGSNAGVARPEDQPPGEDDHLRAFFEATRRGAIETLRFQATRRATDLLWEPVATARRTIDLVEGLRPDAILVDHVAFGATLGLRAAGIPYADVVLGHPTQLPVADETFGVPSAWPAALRPDAAAEAGLRDHASRVVGRFTAAYNDALQTIAPAAQVVPDAFAAHGSVVLLNYPEALHDRTRTAALPARHAFLGSALRVEQAGREASAWLGGDADRPLVVVSFGTFLSARGDVLARVAEALRGLDVRVAVAIGATPSSVLGPIPGDWYVRPHLPQVAMLQHAAAFVTHGGNNSVTEAAALGVPMVVLPFSTDQFDGAAAIESAGLGFAADPNRADPATLRALVGRLIADPPTAVARLAEELGSRPGPATARAAVTAGAAVAA
jgi:MGT family glycosyltransferase